MAFDPISAALDIGGKVIDRLWPDPAQAAAAKLELIKLQQSGELAEMTGQMDINKVEASNPSLFVSGARPFILWICGFGFGLQFIVYPILTWVLAIYGKNVTLPLLDTGTLLTLLGGLLGLGTLRTVERLNGVARQ